MSDRMNPLNTGQLLTWIFDEYQNNESIFGERNFYKAPKNSGYALFGSLIETPFGPAAGPHTQLAENIIAAYLCGARFFELKTVQKLDGEDLPVSKPCIKADDEGYNVEWSTELYVPQAFDEYVKAWVILHLLAKELELGDTDGFIFNMSVGYDLEGIKTPKIDAFIEGLKDASETDAFKNAIKECYEFLPHFTKVTAEDIEAIPSQICNSVTLSTLHGCPPGEIERIATYLITEKNLNTFVKCNPTLLGYEFARNRLDKMGFDYIEFSDFHFKDDLQWEDAVPMFDRLMTLAESRGLTFGLKITNTFPVDITQGELPGEEMYMSGKSLYPLSIELAARIATEFGGKLRISYSGGADARNIADIVAAGVYPVTMATTMLKPGGYMRMNQIGNLLSTEGVKEFGGVSGESLEKLSREAEISPFNIKAVKPLPDRKLSKPLPMTDCFVSPCEEGCPIHQDINAYMEKVEAGDMAGALRIVMDKNPLPFTTGTICAHRCMSKCTRVFYDTSINIRQSKLLAARGGYETVLSSLVPSEKNAGKVAVIGGGPAAIATAFFLLKKDFDVTVFSDKEKLGGVPGDVIPSFRIEPEAIAADVSFVEKMGAEIKCNHRINSLEEVKDYDYVVLALGAPKKGSLDLGEAEGINAIDFLSDFKKGIPEGKLGETVVVIGGGNTAMDTARAAGRVAGVKAVYLAYRRDRRNMPADEEELMEALAEGVIFKALRSPVSYDGSVLKTEIMVLGERDSSGRRSPVGTGEYEEIQADTVIVAVGEKVDSGFYKDNGIEVDEKGFPVVDSAMRTKLPNVYIVGDGRRDPKTVVEGIADAKAACEDIVRRTLGVEDPVEARGPVGAKGPLGVEDPVEARGPVEAKAPVGAKGPVGAKDRTLGIGPAASKEDMYLKKGYIVDRFKDSDYGRCLNCRVLCENCVDVCPNRANVEIRLDDGSIQILHIDRLCNECGNCASFCPYKGAPYLDKLTLFSDSESFEDSGNNGFYINDTFCRLRIEGKIYEFDIAEENTDIQEISRILQIIRKVGKEYRYLYI